ncbi:MAG: hypothetical protein IMZ60_04165 [Actinobacteria bacterium]|nr:hypothetical protein [Actinomycetota bacterium]
MNTNTEGFINDEKFYELYKQLSATHKPDKVKIEKECLEAIGLVIVKFQRLESTMQDLVGWFLDIQDRQRMMKIITLRMSFKNLVSTARALSSEVNFHRNSDLELLLNKALDAEEIRNQIIHSLWTSGPRIKADLKNKVGLIFKFEDYSSDELMEIAITIDQLDTAFNSITFEYLQYSYEHGNPLKGYLIISS